MFRAINSFPSHEESSWVAVLKAKEGLNKFNEPQSGIFARIVAQPKISSEEEENIFCGFFMYRLMISLTFHFEWLDLIYMLMPSMLLGIFVHILSSDVYFFFFSFRTSVV